jgi:4-oxalomesaconate tautomerase
VSVATAFLMLNDKWLMLDENIFLDKNHSPLTIQHSTLSIEHPSGEFTVNLEYEFIDNQIKILKSGVIRTARILSRGEVYVPE